MLSAPSVVISGDVKPGL